jgi:hypothetical protein
LYNEGDYVIRKSEGIWRVSGVTVNCYSLSNYASSAYESVPLRVWREAMPVGA